MTSNNKCQFLNAGGERRQMSSLTPFKRLIYCIQCGLKLNFIFWSISDYKTKLCINPVLIFFITYPVLQPYSLHSGWIKWILQNQTFHFHTINIVVDYIPCMRRYHYYQLHLQTDERHIGVVYKKSRGCSCGKVNSHLQSVC